MTREALEICVQMNHNTLIRERKYITDHGDDLLYECAPFIGWVMAAGGAMTVYSHDDVLAIIDDALRLVEL